MSEEQGEKKRFGKFNPAFYARRVAREDEDGNVIYEKDLPLAARILWMYSDCPGWRITSDGYSVMNLKDESGNPTYFVHGHVAVIDEQGIRIASYPASAMVDSPDFAVQWFEVGTTVALNFLGFSVHNISAAQWEEALQVRVEKNFTPEGFEPPEFMSEPRFNAVSDPGRLRPLEAMPELDDRLPTDGDDPEDSPLLERALELSEKLCRLENPKASPADVQNWLERTLYTRAGAPNWENTSATEQAEIVRYLHDTAKKKGVL